MTDALLGQLQSALDAACTLERELSGGGMSRVFVTHEAALGGRVVVKVLRDDVVPDLSADRFAELDPRFAGLLWRSRGLARAMENPA